LWEGGIAERWEGEKVEWWNGEMVKKYKSIENMLDILVYNNLTYY